MNRNNRVVESSEDSWAENTYSRVKHDEKSSEPHIGPLQRANISREWARSVSIAAAEVGSLEVSAQLGYEGQAEHISKGCRVCERKRR